MDKGGADMPATPNPEEIAAAQYKLNADTAQSNARLNNVNTSTPFGGTTWTETVDPDTGSSTWSQGLSLSDQGQDILSSAFDYSDLPTLLGGDDLLEQLQETEQSAYDRSVELLTPQLEQEEASLLQDLAQRGLPVGGEAWNNAMTNYNQSKNLALTQAAQDATQTALEQQAQLYGQSLNARQQAVSEKTDPYSMMMDTISSMKTGTGYTADSTDYSSLVAQLYGTDVDAAQQEANRENNLLLALLS